MSDLPRGPILTVDCVCFDPREWVLLIRRGNPPFQGAYALPGGFMETGETAEEACRRELAEETGLDAETLQLIGVYSDPDRDPRGHTVSIAYLSRIGEEEPTAGSDAAGAEWIEDWRSLDLAFDHKTILADAVALLRNPSR